MTIFRKSILVIVAVCFVCGVGPALVKAGPKTDGGVIRIAGSATTASVLENYAIKFKKSRPQSNVVVIGGKTNSGLDGVLNGGVDIAMMSRKMTDRELQRFSGGGVELLEKVLGVADVPVVVNAANPMTELDMGQLRKILSGKVRNWKELGGFDEPISIVFVDSEGSRDKFFSTILAPRNRLSGISVTPNAQPLLTHSTLLAVITKRRGAIAFCRPSDLDRLDAAGKGKAVRVLALKADPNSRGFKPVRYLHDGIRAKEPYEIDRAYYIYFKANAAGSPVEEFAKFCSIDSAALAQKPTPVNFARK